MRATLEKAPESSMAMPKDMVTVRIQKRLGVLQAQMIQTIVMFEVFHKTPAEL